jgi:hypothetical protein
MKLLRVAALGGAAAFALSGCATVGGTRPGDMTIPEHEQAAAVEQKKADAAPEGRTIQGHGPAWGVQSRARHLELAKKHAQAAELRRAEVAATCEGVTAPLAFASMRVEHVEAIREATVPPERRSSRGYYPEYLKGARVALSVTEGATAAATARSVQCEVARVSSGMEEASPASPLAVRTARANVALADSGLVVEIRSADSKDAAEILRRAEAMAARTRCQ